MGITSFILLSLLIGYGMGIPIRHAVPHGTLPCAPDGISPFLKAPAMKVEYSPMVTMEVEVSPLAMESSMFGVEVSAMPSISAEVSFTPSFEYEPASPSAPMYTPVSAVASEMLESTASPLPMVTALPLPCPSTPASSAPVASAWPSAPPSNPSPMASASALPSASVSAWPSAAAPSALPLSSSWPSSSASVSMTASTSVAESAAASPSSVASVSSSLPPSPSATSVVSRSSSPTASPSTSLSVSPSAMTSASSSPWVSPSPSAKASKSVSLSPVASSTTTLTTGGSTAGCKTYTGESVSIKFRPEDAVSYWTYIEQGLEWRRGDPATAVDARGVGMVCFSMMASRSTPYYLTAVTRAAHGTEHNDVWIRFSGGLMARKRNVVRNLGKPRKFVKAYQNYGAGKVASTIYTVDHNPHSLQTMRLKKSKKYELCISGRSSKFAIFELMMVACEGETCRPDSAHIRDAMQTRKSSCV